MLIEVENLVKSYQLGGGPVPVLHGVNLKIDSGEYLAIMGSSGSGKSTLMNILGCMDRPTSGRYLLEGRDISAAGGDERARIRNTQIGFIFQSFNLLPRTSALENVVMPLTYSPGHISDEAAYDRACQLLELVGLKDRMHHHPSQLSGGQQQRVAIARSLICSPSILLADEPTGNLDSHSTEEILKLFDDLHKRENLTIIIVTHESQVAERAKRTIHIKDGLIDADTSAGSGQGGRTQ